MTSLKLYKKKSRFDFGKYKGKKVKRVLKDDPGYILWCVENVSHFNPSKAVKNEAMDWFNNDDIGYHVSGNNYYSGQYEADYDYEDPMLWEDPLNF